MSEATQKKSPCFTRKEWSWIMYDWANSVYATNIMAAIFPTIFVAMAGDAGDIWWGYATSIATFLIALMAPVLGAIADYKGMKKKLFTGFMLFGVAFTAVIGLTNDWRVMLIGYIISRIGFSGSNLFYDSFLTDVTDNDRMDQVSSWGYAMGYLGGSTIPFVISIVMLLLLGYGSPVAQKFSIFITSIWWLLFSIPFLKNVRQEHYIERSGALSIGETFRNIGRTAVDLFRQKGLFLFTVAYFFYIDGVGTIISVSTAYGSVLGLGSVGMILALLVTQIVAVPCSILFSRIAARVTARKALIGGIAIYILVCIVGFYMGASLEPHQEAYEAALQADFTAVTAEMAPQEDAVFAGLKEDCLAAFRAEEPEKALQALREKPESAAYTALLDTADAFLAKNGELAAALNQAISFSSVLFWCMAFLVGTVQGGVQAVSRSYFGKLIPKERSNEYFGFFDIFGKFASVLGPFLYSAISAWTGRSSYGVLCLIVLFLIGLMIMVFGKKHLEAISAENA